jgi:hypothetical protein
MSTLTPEVLGRIRALHQQSEAARMRLEDNIVTAFLGAGFAEEDLPHLRLNPETGEVTDQRTSGEE